MARDREIMISYFNTGTVVYPSPPSKVDGVVRVVTVDEDNKETGTAEKIEAHIGGGILHRAFSVYIFNTEGSLLLQRRSLAKYHFGGLWTNTCCGHAVSGESIAISASRRLTEEMGFQTTVEPVGSFAYTATCCMSGLTERELDHVFTGIYSLDPHPDPSEVDDWRWISLPDLKKELTNKVELFTPWFKYGLEILVTARKNSPE